MVATADGIETLKPGATCVLLLALTGAAVPQAPLSAQSPLEYPHIVWPPASDPSLYSRVARSASLYPLPADVAMRAFERETARQATELQGYTVTTLITVELPDMLQRGEFELQRVYVAPKTLQFTPVRFTGDNFVKTNVISRLLRAEVDNLRDPQFTTAVNRTNYRISYKGTTQIDGRLVYAYQLKPRKRRVGLFEGRMFLDAFSGSLVRNEGRLVRNPSLILKRVDFAQDYMDIDGFTFLKHAHSVASTRLIGRTTVDIYHSNYRFPSALPDASGGPVLVQAEADLPPQK